MPGRAPYPATFGVDDGFARESDRSLRTQLYLGALPGAIPCARLHARSVLWEWGLDALSDDTELVVSELVTNGIAASRRHASRVSRAEPLIVPMPVCLVLCFEGDAVVVQVWDADPDAPIPENSGPDADGGRGLLIVQALAETWSWYRLHGASGKVVWARIHSTAGTSEEAFSTGERPFTDARERAGGGAQ
jgi:anti-sigma regulatory factor (Ser/Thr protein kinase)